MTAQEVSCLSWARLASRTRAAGWQRAWLLALRPLLLANPQARVYQVALLAAGVVAVPSIIPVILLRDERDEAFPPRPGPMCGWCDFAQHCPEGKAASAPRAPWSGLPEEIEPLD